MPWVFVQQLVIALLARAPNRRSVVDVLLAQIRPSRVNDGVELREKGDGPHEEAAGDGEDDGGAPESGREVRQLGVLIGEGGQGAYTWFSPLGEKNHATNDMATTITNPIIRLQL